MRRNQEPADRISREVRLFGACPRAIDELGGHAAARKKRRRGPQLAHAVFIFFRQGNIAAARDFKAGRFEFLATLFQFLRRGVTLLAVEASDRDKSVAAGLATLDRRIYEQVSEDGSPVGRPTPVILAVAMSVPAESEDDLAAWYTEEHIPMLLEVPGWRRIRRYRLIRAMDGPGPDFLSLHELAGPEVLENPRYRAAISTPWLSSV